MYGIDYAQAVDTELDERLGSLEEIKEAIEALMDTIKSCKNVDDYDGLYCDAEGWLDGVNDDIQSVESKIEGQLKSVSPGWCD